jgi:hypothetical protein
VPRPASPAHLHAVGELAGPVEVILRSLKATFTALDAVKVAFRGITNSVKQG